MILTITEPGPWDFEQPSCRGMNIELFFTERNGRFPDQAVKACLVCPHRVECATYAIESDVDGLWGGLTPGQRQAMRTRQHKLAAV